MPNCDLLIRPAWLLPVAPDNVALEDHAVAITGVHIDAVGPALELERTWTPAETLDLPDHVLLPGLVNAHGHAAMTLLRGVGEDLSLQAWLTNRIWPLEAEHVNEDFVGVGTELAIAEMLLSGTTCFADMYFFPETVAAITTRVGMRAQLAFPVIKFENAWSSSVEECLHKGLALGDTYRYDPLVTVAFGPHAAYTVDPEDLEKVLMYSEELDWPIQIHLHENPAEVEDARAVHGRSWLAHLNDIGLLSPRLQAVHMTTLDDNDLALTAETGIHVVHCPHSNLKLGSGICPTATLTRLGVSVALGTDGAASNNGLDLFAEARLASDLAKGTTLTPTALPAPDALRMATLGGATALGLADRVGSIQPGKQADLIAVDVNHVTAQPMYDPFAQLLHTASASRVTEVWVAGRRLVAGRALTTINTEALLGRTRRWRDRIAHV